MNAGKVRIFLIVILLLGLLDALYLAYTALTHTEIKCFLVSGCDTVAQSPHSRFLGVPLAVYGVVYYLGMLLVVLAHYVKQVPLRIHLPLLAFLGGIVGVLFSLYFIYVQAVLIGAMCIYCIISALATGIIFVASALYYRLHKIT